MILVLLLKLHLVSNPAKLNKKPPVESGGFLIYGKQISEFTK
jgi:hypothetical protein